MRNHEFYIDVGKATRRGIIGRVNVSLNGRRVKNVIAAKSGVNGFIEYQPEPLRRKGDEFLTVKKRGLVKVSINANS